MGESSACLLRSFSQPSSTFQESTEEDEIHRALTSSVSFGRFISEPLAWEKWSSFRENRYLEEAEKYSKPGSVAEKKAYFEAHYKKIAAKKAAALLEQQSSAVHDVSAKNKTNESDDNSPAEMALAQESVHGKIEEMQGESTIDTDISFLVDGSRQTLPESRNMESTRTEGAEQAMVMELAQESEHTKIEEIETDLPFSVDRSCQTLSESRNMESTQAEGAEQAREMELAQESEHTKIEEIQGESRIDTDLPFSVDRSCLTLAESRNMESTQTEGAVQATKHPILAERDVKSSNNLPVDLEIHDEQEVKTSFENPSTTGNSVASDKNETSLASGKPSGSKIRSSIKPNIPIYPRKWDPADNPINKKTSIQSLEKKRSTPQALHMSISFTSRVKDTSKTSSPVSQKIIDSGCHKPLVRKSAQSSNEKTLTRASVGGMPKHLGVISQIEDGRAKTHLDQSVSISQGRKSNSFLHIGKSKPLCGSKVKLSTVSSSFGLRSEERAAKRKEFFQKLEQKMNSEVEKEPLQSKQKGKAKGGLHDAWKSVSSLAEANANFHSLTKSASIATKKIVTRPYSPKERKLAPEVQDNNSRPPWRFSMKTDSFRDVAEKNSSRLIPKKSMLENTSPNIQLYTYRGCSKTNTCRRSIKE